MSSFGGLMDGRHYPITVHRASQDGIQFISNYLTVSAGPIDIGSELSASIALGADTPERFEADVRLALDLFNKSYKNYGY